MAITAEAGILGMLKTYYAKEGLVNLLYRNDPLLKDIKKERVEGKQANFSALYSRGGAVSANYTKAKELAKTTAQAKEFQVVPGQLFSACVFNNKELLASKSLRGAYINVASAKFFANAESFRKTLAVALYGTGHGELFTVASNQADFTAGTAATVTFPRHAIMGIDIGSEIEFKATPSTAATASTPTGTVTAINGTSVTIMPKVGGEVASKVACIAGCSDSTGAGLLPVGLAGWLPKTNPSSGESFFGVDRSIARDRLAGTYINGNGQAKYKTIEDGILALRAMGSLCDKIVMNDEDYLDLAREIEAKTYFTKANGGEGKTKANVGYKDFGFSVSTNWLENVIDSPYCPKGTAYILDSGTIELWTLTNAEKVADGISGNEAGKPDVNGETDVQDKPYQLLVNDMFTINAGEDTIDGPAAVVALNFYGQFVITNPSVNAVISF